MYLTNKKTRKKQKHEIDEDQLEEGNPVKNNQKEDLAFSCEIFDLFTKENMKEGAVLLTIAKKLI